MQLQCGPHLAAADRKRLRAALGSDVAHAWTKRTSAPCRPGPGARGFSPAGPAPDRPVTPEVHRLPCRHASGVTVWRFGNCTTSFRGHPGVAGIKRMHQASLRQTTVRRWPGFRCTSIKGEIRTPSRPSLRPKKPDGSSLTEHRRFGPSAPPNENAGPQEARRFHSSHPGKRHRLRKPSTSDKGPAVLSAAMSGPRGARSEMPAITASSSAATASTPRSS